MGAWRSRWDLGAGLIACVALFESACGSSAERDDTTPGQSPGRGGGSGASNAGGTTQQGGDTATTGGGGSAGSAGEPFNPAGQGGGGTDACGSELGSACDDENPCTRDDVGEDCECRHEALAPGAACDDGDPCTAADACEQGACSGTFRTSVPSVIGTLGSFGAALGLQTLVALPSQDRAVFATGQTLSLVAIEGGALTRLDTFEPTAGVRIDSVGAMTWVSRPRTFLVPLAGGLVAMASNAWGIDLYDISGDRVMPSERYGATSLEAEVLGAAGHGRRLYTCSSFRIHSYSIDAVTNEIRRGAVLELPLRHGCQALAVNPQGTRLFVATTVGLDVVDTSSEDGALVLGPSALEGESLLEVAASERQLVAYALGDRVSGLGDVHVLGPDTLEVTRSFAVEPGPRGPLGFGLLADDRLLLQRFQSSGSCVEHTAEVYDFGAAASAAPSQSWTSLAGCKGSFGFAPFHTVAFGRVAVLEPMHLLVDVDPESSELTPLHGLEQGSFERVTAAGPTSVEAHGPGSMHRIDLSDPSAPTVTAGGLLAPARVEGLRLRLSESRRPVLLTVTGPGDRASGPKMTVYSDGPNQLPRVAGSLVHDDAEGEWITAGDALFQLSPGGDLELRLRRFATSSIRARDDQELTPDLDRVLSPRAPSELTTRLRVFAGVDAEDGDLATLDWRSNTPGNVRAAVLSVFSAADDLAWAFSAPAESGVPMGVALAEGRVLVLYEDRAVLFDRAGAELTRHVFDGFSANMLLAFGGGRVHLSVSYRNADTLAGVLVLRAEDLTELGRYGTAAPVTSLGAVGENLVFGMRSSLAVASPACGAD